MKVVVTGATGLVGSRLVSRLLEQGLDCHAVVRRPGSAPAGAYEVIGALFDGDTLAQVTLARMYQLEGSPTSLLHPRLVARWARARLRGYGPPVPRPRVLRDEVSETVADGR